MNDREMRLAAFTEALRTARTKDERARTLEAFLNGRPSRPEIRDAARVTIGELRDAEFRKWLSGPGHDRAFENRAAGEGTGSTGGYLVPTRFYASVIRYMKEYDSFLKAFEPWESPDGEPYDRTAFSQFSSGATDTENTAFTEGPYPTLAQQSWPSATTYAASYLASNQLVQDAFRYTTPANAWDVAKGASAPFVTPEANAPLDTMIASALGESLGRAIAPVASAALYSSINSVGASSGQNGGYLALGAATTVNFSTGATTELAAKTLALDTCAQMIELLDVAYLETSSWYFSSAAWGGILRQVSTSDKKIQYDPSKDSRSLYGIPVVLTSQVSQATASTVSGPVLGDLNAAMTLRTVANSFGILRSTERYAESLQTYYRCWLRGDAASRDSRAVVGVKYNAT